MAYEYRKMTTMERQEVIRQRKVRGYPLHAPPHPFRDRGQYLFTASTFEHAAILASPTRCSSFEINLIAAIRDAGAEPIGWVILPNHYHLLADVESMDRVSAGLRHLHGVTSREWNLVDDLTGRRRVWYRFTDRMIRDTAHFYRALNYIHVNPLRHRWVKDPYSWPWSSIHGYLDVQGRDWLRNTWKEYPLGDFGKGWDSY